MSTAAYLRLPEEIRIAVWEHSSEILYQLIAQSLGHKYRHWIGRVATGDGYGCYEAMLLRDNECTSGAKNAFLTELMGLEMRMTGSDASAPCIMTYYGKLNELNAKYAKSNANVGVPVDILRAKLLELPERYSFPQHCLG